MIFSSNINISFSFSLIIFFKANSSSALFFISLFNYFSFFSIFYTFSWRFWTFCSKTYLSSEFLLFFSYSFISSSFSLLTSRFISWYRVFIDPSCSSSFSYFHLYSSISEFRCWFVFYRYNTEDYKSFLICWESIFYWSSFIFCSVSFSVRADRLSFRFKISSSFRSISRL